MNEETFKLDLIKMKTLNTVKATVKRMRRQTGRKYLQNPHPIKDMHPAYAKNF